MNDETTFRSGASPARVAAGIQAASKKGWKWLRRLALMAILGLCSAVQPAKAMMESNPHQLPLADQGTFEQILAVPGGRELLGGTGRVYAEQWEWRGNDKFLIARVEDTTCDGEYCLTAFISVQDAGSRIIGLGWLPKKVLDGDVTYDFCRVCGDSYGLSFVDSKDKWITIGISRNYLVIPGNTK